MRLYPYSDAKQESFQNIVTISVEREKKPTKSERNADQKRTEKKVVERKQNTAEFSIQIQRKWNQIL